MAAKCSQCAAPTIWDEQVGSAVCTSCGSLEDPSQSLLTSAQYPAENSHLVDASTWHVSASTTLKSLRSGNNWDLSGQGKEARDRRNAAAIGEFMKSLASSLNAPGLSPRAITLFNQAKLASDFRWGTKSRAIAAACVAVALRESNRPAIGDIASLLDVPPTSVAREFARITSALGLSLAFVDPVIHLPSLQAHLSAALLASGLSNSLSVPLKKINLHSATATATSLSHLLARLSPDHDILRLPAPPTACATFMLALEAEIRAPLNPLGDLARCLGQRLQVAKSVVMTRYKTVQDAVAFWAKNVPWLDKYESNGGRAKLSKRLIVARGIKDVIQFQHDIWQERTKLFLNLHPTDEEQEQEQEHWETIPSRLKMSRVLDQATRFLLDPLGNSVASLHSTPEISKSQLSIATYLLAAPSASSSGRAPSRLQLLATLRGGTDQDKITDEELFTKGELEGLLRNEHEIRILRETLGWLEDEDPKDDSEESRPRRGTKRPAKDDEEADEILRGSAFRGRKKTRVDMNALAQFLAEDHGEPYECGASQKLFGLEEVVNETADLGLDLGESEDDLDQPFETIAVASTSASAAAQDGGEVIVDEWRPPSPEIGVIFGDSQYDEEYD